MDVDLRLLGLLDLKGAVELELTRSNRLMPRRPDRLALEGRADDVRKLFRNRYAKGQFGELADIVFVEKNRRGRRPIAETALQDKVLYRALVDHIAKSLPPHLVTRPQNSEFKKAPLLIARAKYVSKTDVASYYEYVDHDRLADELEAQTGEAPAIAVLMELLRRVMGRRVGIPKFIDPATSWVMLTSTRCEGGCAALDTKSRRTRTTSESHRTRLVMLARPLRPAHAR